MKPFFTIAILLSLYFNALSQIDEKQHQGKYFEIGVNASSFVKNFIGLNNSETSISPYIFHFKFLNYNKGLRVHAGFNSSLSQSDNDGFIETNTIISNLKVGYEQRTIASKRWMVLYGVDAVGNLRYAKTTSITFEEVDISSQELELGISSFIGFAFYISPKIYLSTEASIDFLNTATEIKTNFGDPLVPDQVNARNDFEISTKLPTNLNFTIKF